MSGIRVCLKGICCGIRVRFNDVPVFHRRVEDEVVNIGIWKVGFVCGWRTTCVVLRRDSGKRPASWRPRPVIVVVVWWWCLEHSLVGGDSLVCWGIVVWDGCERIPRWGCWTWRMVVVVDGGGSGWWEAVRMSRTPDRGGGWWVDVDGSV